MINTRGVKLPRPHMQFTFLAKCDIGPEWHWVQFLWRETSLFGVYVPGVFSVLKHGGRKVWFRKGVGGRNVDTTTLDQTVKPYIDTTTPGNTRRLPRELSFVDAPNYDPTATDYTSQIWHFDVFLYNSRDKMVYYHIAYDYDAELVHSKWQANPKILSAGPTHAIPAWARGKLVTGGYTRLDDNNEPVSGSQITYPNPFR